ncbi:hypothetical protein Tco_0586416 [Tanacetum coccineum]
MSGNVPPIPPLFRANTGNPSSPNRVGNPIDTINNTTTTSVVQNVVDENLPQLLDSRGGSHVTNVPEFDKEDFSTSLTDLILAHEGPSKTRDTKIAALRLKFNAFKALEGERVKGTFTRLKCLLNDLENNGILISQAEDSKSDIKEYQKSSSEFLADLYTTQGSRLVAESYDWDEESMSTDDEGVTTFKALMVIADEELSIKRVDASSYQNEITKLSLENESLKDEISDLKKVIEKWTSSRVTFDQLLTDQVPGNIVRALGGKGMRKKKSSNEVVFTKSDVSTSETSPDS